MNTINICNEQFERLLERAKIPILSEFDTKEIETVRQNFLQNYNLGKIFSLTKEDYFSDFNKEVGCFEFDLEVTTKILGDIQSGFANKYGKISDFPIIKSLFEKIIWLDATKVYNKDGSISIDFSKILLLSKEIEDFEKDKKVLPKFLSVFFPDIFLPIFDQQEELLKKLLNDSKVSEKNGLENYIENNFKLLVIKKKLEGELTKVVNGYEFSRLLDNFILEERNSTDLQNRIKSIEIVEERIDSFADFHNDSIIKDASEETVNSLLEKRLEVIDSVVTKEIKSIERSHLITTPIIGGISINKSNFDISNLENENNLISLKTEFNTANEKINYKNKIDMSESIIQEPINKSITEELDTKTYQILLHTNRTQLLPTLRYFDNEKQLLNYGQFDTGVVGVMDMLTVDENGDFVVIEFKRDKKDESLGKILRYMGWTKSELCTKGQSVKGIIIADHNDLNLVLISKAVPNLTFLKLSVDISLTEQK